MNFASTVHLVGRYPELASNDAFVKWTSQHASEKWHEQQDGDFTTIVLQSKDGLSVFAAQVGARAEPEDEIEVKQTEVFNLLETGQLATPSLLNVTKSAKIVDPSKIHAIRPIVTFADGGGATLEWEVELSDDNENRTYRVLKDGTLRELPKSNYAPPEIDHSKKLIRPMADDLASNELHNLSQMRADAHSAIGSATTVAEKARRVFNYVRKNYTYDGNITHISEFTWADILTRNTNNRRGICDEWAVVQISMLRSIGIPARIKFLIWQQGGEGVGHACLEYRNGSTWYHMDALWNALHNKARYRNSGATSVTVMDADSPRDSRSTTPAWGVPDPTGDRKLNPYGDFVINPSYPGNARAGYSH